MRCDSATVVVISCRKITAESGISAEKGWMRIFHSNKAFSGKIKTVRVQGVVGAQGVDQQPLKTVEVLSNVLGLGIGHKVIRQFLFQSFQHTNWSVFLESLTQVGSYLQEGILGLKCFFINLHMLSGIHLFFAEVSWFLIVDELIQKFFILHVDKIHKVTPGLMGYISAPDVLLVNAIHAHQHFLILASLFSSPSLFQSQTMGPEVPPDLERTNSTAWLTSGCAW